jgi:hypothetical protein
VRYTLLCDGQPVGHIDLANPVEGSASGLLEPSPAFARVREVLERGRRLEEQATIRMFMAWRAGTLPRPEQPPALAGDYLVAREMTSDEAAVFGNAALEALAAAQAIELSLQEADGTTVLGAEVMLWPFGWPGEGGPDRPEVSVFLAQWRAREDDPTSDD